MTCNVILIGCLFCSSAPFSRKICFFLSSSKFLMKWRNLYVQIKSATSPSSATSAGNMMVDVLVHGAPKQSSGLRRPKHLTVWIFYQVAAVSSPSYLCRWSGRWRQPTPWLNLCVSVLWCKKDTVTLDRMTRAFLSIRAQWLRWKTPPTVNDRAGCSNWAPAVGDMPQALDEWTGIGLNKQH